MSDAFDEASLKYHRADPPGKLAIVATKPLAAQNDLAMAYTPGVAAACQEIARDPANASSLTGRANLVAVITNGTAVLGLGPIGPLAAKPVMEGKAVLFKKFANIDVFDIEIDERDPEKLVEIVAGLEPTFGGINLEDIKAPECFAIEAALRERMRIPVFHDDQHGTAIIVGTAIVNGLRLVDKPLADVKVVTSGAGASAIACLNLLVGMGLPRDNVTMCDSRGVVYVGRVDGVDQYKAQFARETDARTLQDAIKGADVFLGLSAPGVVTPQMVKEMADKPLILALANPEPEIMPDEAKAARPDAIVATGRSDFPNQVNNVLCFPFIFRGALDVGATTINEEMKLACVRALSDLAMAAPSDEVTQAYGAEPLTFGPDYLIPKLFDPRLILEVAPAVAAAAMESGVATRPIDDLEEYRQRLSQFVFRSGHDMKPIFEAAKSNPRRVVYAEGEERRVLQAVRQVIDQGIAAPILIGRPAVIESRIGELGLRLTIGKELEVVDPNADERYFEYWSEFHRLTGRIGYSREAAKTEVRTNTTAIAALMTHRGEANAMLCGTDGRYRKHLETVYEVIGTGADSRALSALTMHIIPAGTFFICDTHVIIEPSAEELAEMVILSASEVQRFGIAPKIALLSRSNFGSHDLPSAKKMQVALEILRARAPDLEVDGEMHADAALSESIRKLALPESRLHGRANLLVMPNVDAANISSNLVKGLCGGVSVGPILVGTARPAHVVTQSITVRGLLNMTAIAVAQAQLQVGDEVSKTMP